MNKVLKISLVAVLAAMPLMANADPVPGDPGATVSLETAPKAANAPGYALKQADPTNDGKVATAGYVKGAYNAAIKAVNKVAAQVDAIDLTGVATQTGVVATINNSSASYTPAGTISDVTIAAMDTWDSDTPGTITIPSNSFTFTGTQATIAPKVSGYNSGI